MSSTSDAIFELTKSLVEIPSASSDISQCEQCLKFVEGYFAGVEGWSIRSIRKSSTSSPALYITSNGPDSTQSKVLFLAHVDVIPMAEYAVHGDPKGVIRGRGVSDMKGPVAALMHIMKSMDPKYLNLAMLVVTDEEIGGIDGAKFAFMDEDGPKISCSVCICPDGGDNFKLVTHEKGVLRYQITATGKSSHSAYPWNGENAMLSLFEEVSRIQNMEWEGAKVFDNTGPQWHTTCVPTIFSAGEVINQVPGQAICKLDIRFTEQWNLEKLQNAIQHCLSSSIASEKIKSKVIFQQPMLLCPPELTWMVSAKRIIESKIKREVEYSRGHGTSDGHWADFPVVMFKPIGGGLHQEDEWLDFPSLVDFHDIVLAIVQEWCVDKERKN